MKFIKKMILIFVLILICVFALVLRSGWEKYEQVISELPLETAALDIKNKESFTPIDEIPEVFVKAMVAVEDRRFYQHEGIDFIGLGRAVRINFKEKALLQGGSSITQQLAKNIYFIGDDTLSRKIAEFFVTKDIENKFSKDEILELYFNVIYYGSGYYCIGDATMGYFGKTPAQLTDYEATILAGIPNAPSVYSLKNNPELAKKRQKKVVEAMVSEEYITQEEADEIISLQ